MGYLAIIETTVRETPCKIGVTYYLVVPPWKGSAHTAPSDLDFYGYTEVSYDILKMNEKPYPWMEKKLLPFDHGMIEDEIIEYFNKNMGDM